MKLDRAKRRVVIDFTLGGAWIVENEVIQKLNWPDPGLQHNGGDVALGAALRQNGYTFKHLRFCDQQNVKRRGFTQPHPSV